MFRVHFVTVTVIAVAGVVLPQSHGQEKKEEVFVLDVTKVKEELKKDKDGWLKKYKGKTVEFQVAFFKTGDDANNWPRGKFDLKMWMPAYGHARTPDLSTNGVFVAGLFARDDDRNKGMLTKEFLDGSHKGKIRGVVAAVDVTEKTGERQYDAKIELNPAWVVGELIDARKRK